MRSRRWRYIDTPKRYTWTNGVKNHSVVAVSFCACCLVGAGRTAADRSVAFLRRKYASRRLRFAFTRCCCPIKSLSIQNRRNAISIEEFAALFTEHFVVFFASPLAKGENIEAKDLHHHLANHSKNPHLLPLLATARRPASVFAVAA